MENNNAHNCKTEYFDALSIGCTGFITTIHNIDECLFNKMSFIFVPDFILIEVRRLLFL